MRVEPCCQSLLAEILPIVDPSQKGVCLDVGVGTFAFYCEIFAKLGFSTIAVEPLPVKKLRQICQNNKINLMESCLSDRNGKQTLYLGKFAGIFNQNFNSLSPEWFGSSTESKEVQAITLAELLNRIKAEKVTCLKLDIEGWEYSVIKQLPELSESLLPSIIMFEYGGGVNRRKGDKGWAPQFFDGTKESLKILRKCGYSSSIMIDYAPKTQEKLFDLQAIDLDIDALFPPDAVYGNIISFRHCNYPENKIAQICSSYYNTGLIDQLVNKIVSR
ncbi:MAG: FkbM family methyltransferase [Microcoleus sp.]